MKLFSTSVLIALTYGEVVEETSLLQNKVLADDGYNGAVHRATSDLSKVTDATAAEVDDMVETFSQDLMKTTALMQVSDAQQAALFRRAFQSAEVSNLVDGYLNLPEVSKHKLVNSALRSDDLAKVFDTMPTEDRTALLVQLDGSHMEKTVAQKTETKVTNDAAGNRKTETVTRDRSGNVVHSHTHVHNARTGQTETATRSKQHRHDHKHNSKTAQTETQTATAGTGHTHGHVTNAKTGVTVTDSTANGYSHHHDHTHTHQNGVTATATNSRTVAGGVASAATHSHVQNNNGATGTATVTGGTAGTHTHRTGSTR